MTASLVGSRLVPTSPDVWYAEGALSTFGQEEIAFLKAQAAASPRLRARICFHENPQAAVHEMLIAHHRSCYVRPHRHGSKAESLIVIEGAARAVFFDDTGEISRTLHIGAAPEPIRAYRVGPLQWHTLVIQSEWLIFLEVSQGPFSPTSSEFPTWAPDGSNDLTLHSYTTSLQAAIAASDQSSSVGSTVQPHGESV